MGYQKTVDAYEVAVDEVNRYSENPDEFLDVDQQNAKVFVIPADTVIYWATPENVDNPKKWCKKPREGMVKLIIPAIIIDEESDDNDDEEIDD